MESRHAGAAGQRAPPAAGKFVPVEGVRRAERGGGPTIVLLHGNGMLANDSESSGLRA
jgi:hypothetical protein